MYWSASANVSASHISPVEMDMHPRGPRMSCAASTMHSSCAVSSQQNQHEFVKE